MKTVHVAGAFALLVVGTLTVAASTPEQSAQDPEVLRYRRVEIAWDRRDEALGLWERFGSHVLSHYGDASFPSRVGETMHVFSPLGRFEHAEAVLRKLESDEGWRALHQQAEGLFLDDRTVLLFFLGGSAFDPGEGPSVLRTTRSPHSRIPLARAFAKRVADHLDARYDGLRVSTYSAAVHDPQAIHWIFEYADHAAFESVHRGLLEDEEYLDLYRLAEGLFLPDETFEARLD